MSTNDSIRVAYIAPYVGPAARRSHFHNRILSLGGTTKIEALATSLADSGADVELLSLGVINRTHHIVRPPDELLPGEHHHSNVRYAPWLDFSGMANVLVHTRVRSLLRHCFSKGPVHVALVYNISPGTLAAARLLREKGVPVVLEYEDSVRLPHSFRSRSRWHSRLLSLRDYFGMRHRLQEFQKSLAGVITVAPGLAEEFPNLPSLVLPGIIPDDLSRRVLPPPRSREADGALRVVYAGGLSRDKGVLALLDAVSLSKNAIRLILCGSGPLAETLRSYEPSSLPSGSKIEFRGLVSRMELLQIFESADCLVNPHPTLVGLSDPTSRYISPFKVIEFSASGRPVVTTPMESLPPPLRGLLVVSENDTALAIAKSLDYVAERPVQLGQQAHAARELVVREYGRTHAGEAVLKFFMSLLSLQ